ncbi:MAG: hypothetical protein FWE67_05255 [Planctomycetaceae bacterium]|nr:hypothetical protein [Planctomycetaceae bacterium]
MAVVPLGLNRISIPMLTNRSYNNVTSAQSLLAKYNEQIQTQRQYRYGSDSPYLASTSLSVQSQIERKAQNVINLSSTLGFLSATDSTMSQFTPMLDDVRGMALDAVNTTTSDAERAALAESTKQVLQQMFNFGNYSYNGRYVFAGSTTSVLPFEWGPNSNSVLYKGTEYNVHSWSDTDLLSQSNMNGVEVFGAISEPVRGLRDVNPVVSRETRLSDLNSGEGIVKGSIRLTYQNGSNLVSVDIDLSSCTTVGDVLNTISGMKNPHFSVNADLTEHGLVLSLPPDTAGSVVVSEVGKGMVARQLGLPLKTSFSANSPLFGTDVNPAVSATTPLDALLGSKARLELRFAGNNNDITLLAKQNGETITDANGRTWNMNGVSVAVIADPDVVPGSESAEYDEEKNQIVLRIHPDHTSANDIIKAVNAASAAGSIPPFDAELTGSDQTKSGSAGTGNVSFLPGLVVLEGTTQYGNGQALDKAGLQIVNGSKTFNISFADCKTVDDMLAELNDPQYGLSASINASKSGFDIRTRISGADFCIGENGGQTAHQLGLRTLDLETQLADLDFNRGVNDYTGPGTPASALYNGIQPNSALLLTSKQEGKVWNDWTLNFVSTSDPNGAISFSIDETNKIICIGIVPGATTACEIVSAFYAQPGPQELFDLALDTTNGANTGAGVVYVGKAITSGGTDGGIDFTITRNDGVVLEIDIHDARTIGDVLRIINEHPDNQGNGIIAMLAEFGNGIQLIDNTFGSSSTRVDRTLLSTAAIELGLVKQGEEYRSIESALADAALDGSWDKVSAGQNASAVVNFNTDNSSLLVRSKNSGIYANGYTIQFVPQGTGVPPFEFNAAARTLTFAIDSGVTTANDIIETFRSSASDQVLSMFDIQNGINNDGSTSSGSGAVNLISGQLSGGTNNVLTGFDANPKEADSLYTALIRMQAAMEKNDIREIERATQLLDNASERMKNARATVGIMQNTLDTVTDRLAEENILHETTLNQTLRIDFADASLNYMAQQLAYQAAMQTAAMMFQMSLLNFI